MKTNKLFVVLALLTLGVASCTDTTTSSSTPTSSTTTSSSPVSTSSPASSSSEESTDTTTSSVEDDFVEPTIPDGYDYYVYYDVNYDGGTDPDTAFVKKARKIAEADIPIPTREGYLFNGWFEDTADSQDNLKAFSFRTAIRKNYHLYAGWIDCSGEHTSTEYVFEAEYCRTIQDMSGMGYSGEAKGTGMISVDDENKSYQASNGYFVTYLYVNHLSLDFTVYSDMAVTDCKFVWRVSAEFRDADLTVDNYDIMVNGKYVNFAEMNITYNPDGIQPFKDITIAETISLVKGANTFSFAANNDTGGMGTMQAIAPMIDCFKLTTTAKLNWLPESSNI